MSLSRSREQGGRTRRRGRVSYATLGISQLGAVYEALLSFRGFFAKEELYELYPSDVEVLAGLGWSLLKMGKGAEAAVQYTSAVACGEPFKSPPPTTSTPPSAKSVAVWPARP